MSEEAKVAYLRKRIKRIRRIGIIYYALSFVGLAWFIYGFIDWGSRYLMNMGVALFVVALLMGFYSTWRKNNLMEQLRKMGYKEKE